MIVHDVVQRSEEWFALRRGRATASRAGDILATGRGGKGEGARRIRYRAELITERMTGHTADRPFSTEHTRRGMDLEAEAVLAWECRTGSLVMPVGFVTHYTLMAGCSPDGIVYGDGLTIDATLEAKCPMQAIHYETLKQQDIVDKDHRAQLLHSVVLTGARIGVFISYCPVFEKPDDRLVAIEWDPTSTERIGYLDKLTSFLAAVDTEEMARLPIAEQLNRDLAGTS